MYAKEVDENMWDEIYQQACSIFALMFNKMIIILSMLGSIFLNIIGFPKEIIVFIFVLSVIDIISKHLSEVIFTYGSLTWGNYFKAWTDKVLTSRQLKNGITIKLILYSIALYIANQLLTIDGILFGKEISGVIYSALVFVELASILENGIHGGYTGLTPWLNFIKNKQKQLFGGKEDNK